ncbi:unnamed protein product [Rotaria magnacalcarata]|uniref:Uncharacterized protein n=5 Tax=Rotaria magnacalcarata TaxID=392030 RepID=A0A816HCX8_9BILA|nr:unnamed protein product [Rotaria magnacalcarata]
MVSKKIATEKKGGAQQKQRAEEKSEQMVLIRDEASQTLMIVDTGMQITWYDDSDEQIIGPILAIENITKPNTEEQQPLHSTITIGDNNIPHSQLHDDESRDSHSSAVHIMEDEETQENSSLVPTSDNSNTQKSSRGEKRRSEELSTNANNRKKLSNASLSVSYPSFSAKEQECLALQGELDYYKQEWMRNNMFVLIFIICLITLTSHDFFLTARPKDRKVIQYLIEITNILSGNDKIVEYDIGETLTDIMSDLNMSEQQLQQCHGRSATVTARRIMKFKYPKPDQDLKIKKIEESILQAIIKYTKISNPADTASEASIRHAMSNYVAVQKFKNRLSQIPTPNQLPEEGNEDGEDNDN